MFLNKEELIELTARQRRDCQVKMLRGMGVEHRVRADGSIAVLTTHVEQMFGVAAGAKMIEKAFEPNWGAL